MLKSESTRIGFNCTFHTFYARILICENISGYTCIYFEEQRYLITHSLWFYFMLILELFVWNCGFKFRSSLGFLESRPLLLHSLRGNPPKLGSSHFKGQVSQPWYLDTSASGGKPGTHKVVKISSGEVGYIMWFHYISVVASFKKISLAAV